MRGSHKSIENLSANALLRLETNGPARKALKCAAPLDQRAPSNRKRGEGNLLIAQIELFVDSDPAIAVEILLPDLKRMVKKLTEIEKRKEAVSERPGSASELAQR